MRGIRTNNMSVIELGVSAEEDKRTRGGLAQYGLTVEESRIVAPTWYRLGLDPEEWVGELPASEETVGLTCHNPRIVCYDGDAGKVMHFYNNNFERNNMMDASFRGCRTSGVDARDCLNLFKY